MKESRSLSFKFAALSLLLGASAWAQAPGTITTVVGNFTSGNTGDGSAAMGAELGTPYGIAFDAAGNMYISDYGAARIRKVDTSGIIHAFAGTGSYGQTGDGSAALSATLGSIWGIGTDAAGNLLITDDSASTIRQVDHTSLIINSVIGTSSIGYGTCPSGSPTSLAIYTAHDVKVDASGNIYFLLNYDSCVEKIDHTTGLAAPIAGTANRGYNGDNISGTTAELYYPDYLAVDASGNVFVSDTYNNRVRRIDAVSGIITTVAGNGTPGYNGDDIPATGAELNAPDGIAVDSAGNIYVSDSGNYRIRKIDTSGLITTVVGNGTAGSIGDNGQGTSAEINMTYGGLAVNGSFLYISDDQNHVIRRLVLPPPVATNLGSETVNQTNTASTVYFNSITGTPASFTMAYGTDFAVNGSTCSGGANYGSCSVTFTPKYPGLRRDALVAKDSSGNIIGTEYVYGIGQGALGVVTPGKISSINLSSFGSVRGIGAAFDPAGNLYIVDSPNDRLIKVDTSGNARLVTITGATLSTPSGIVVDGAGNLDIADSGNDRIVQVATSGAATIITPSVGLLSPTGIALASNGTLYVADSGNARIVEIPASGTSSVLSLATTLMTPVGLTFDAAGDLYIADSGLHSIVMLPAAGTDSVLTSSIALSTPTGIWTDPAGNLYVADSGLNEVLRLSSTGTATVIAGSGTAGDTGDGGLATGAELNAPTAVALAPNGTVYITDALALRTISPAAMAFSTTNVSATTDQTVAVINIGNLAYTFPASFIFGRTASEFSLVNTGTGDCSTLYSSSFAVAASCNLEVEFAPTVASSYTDTLTLATGLQLSLSGTGLAVASTVNPLALSATALNFGSQQMAVAARAQTFTLTNNGAAAVSLSSLTLSGINAADFTVTSTCGSTLAASASCTVIAVFSPSTTGSESANLTFTDSVSGTTYSQTVALGGTGVAVGVTGPAVPSVTSLSVPSLFVDGSGSTQTITLTNTGTNGLAISGLALSGTNAADFTVTSSCGTTLAVGATCTIGIVFIPSVTGNESATLAITYTDAVSGVSYTQNVSLTGVGLSGLPTGTVEILNRNSGKTLDVLNLSTADGAAIQQYSYLAGANQQWQFVPDGNGYYTIKSINSGKVLDVTAFSTDDGAKIQQWDNLGTDNQKWQVTQLSDSSFTITNKLSGKLLDVTALATTDGALIQQWSSTGANNQKWSIIAAQQYFTITNKLSNKVLDVSAYSILDGALLQQWTSLGGTNQEWQFVSLGNGYYQILNHNSGMVLDATDPTGTISDGTLVQQWDYLGGANQQWQLIPTGGGYFEIANKVNGKVLDVKGLSTSDGASIQIWTYLGTANQQWSITDVQ